MKKFTGLALLTLFVMLAAACSNDTLAVSEGGSANITVNIASRGQVDTDNSEVKPGEGIKTLRLIMVQEGKVAGNWLREYNDNSLKQTFRIMGVKAVDTYLCAIVNEKGVNVDYNAAFPVGQAFDNRAYDLAMLHEPDVATHGIPMEGYVLMKQADIVNEAQVHIKVTRALARVDLTVNNKTGGDLQIREINFGAFFPVAGYLRDYKGTIVLNQAKNFTETQTVAPAVPHTFTYYLFDPMGGTYTVGMKGSIDYKQVQIYDAATKRPVTELNRNQILKINANANPTGWELRCEVAPWIVKEHEVNYTDNLSYTSHGWVPGTIAGRQENTVELSPGQEAELKFVIQAPNGVTRWIAELDDNTNFELLTKEGTTIFDSQKHPIEQTLKVRVNPTATDPSATTKLHVYAVVGTAAHYELDLTDSKGTADLNNFTLKRAGGQ